jgi:putative nucleotidyltransferase with HDIG domain
VKIDFKKELETASKGMIMIHDPKLLIQLIVRMIVRKVTIKHAAMILFEPQRNEYVLSISRGEKGFRIPQGYTRFTFENPLIQIFLRKEYRALTIDRNAIVADDINRLIWRESIIENGNGKDLKELLYRVDEQMKLLNAVACVPAYYRHKLLAILLLGEKHNGEKFNQQELNFFAALASDAAMAIRNAQLFEDLKREAARNHGQFIQTLIVLGSAIEAKDAYTRGHTERVTKYAVALARQMNENGSSCLDEKFIENLYISGLLHDIGKIGVPESILNKKDKLTDEEFEVMKQHTVRGVEIVRPLSLAKESIDGIMHHHERYDGKGYPAGLTGEDIPLSAAIISVADAYDAMTSDRPYRKGWNKNDAINQILQFSGIQFNPVPVAAIKELYQKGVL